MTQRIPLANGRGFALVDDADVALVSQYRWHILAAPHTNYARARTAPRPNRRATLMHILIMGQPGIDHRDGNGLNCQRYNLRIATQGQNLANQRKTRGTSRFKGVHWDKDRRRWFAQIKVNQRRRNLGRFTDEADAARAYDAAALEAWGEYARLNFPL